MKKIFPVLITAMLCIATLVIPASAAGETFTDTVEDGFPKAHSWSDHMCFQYNDDMECTILVKQSDTGSPSTTEYIIYRMESEITGFSLDCMHVNGLGNGVTDIKVFVSADCANWSEVPLKATEQVFDDEIYIDFDHAYWLRSTVSNKASVPSGCLYIKIEIEPFTVPESCTWNTVIDTVNVTLSGSSAASVSSGNPASENPVSDNSSGSPADGSSEPLQSEPSDTAGDSSNSSNLSEGSADSAKNEKASGVSVWIVVAIGAVAVAAIAVAVVAVLKNKKSPSSDSAQVKDDQEDSSQG